MKPPSVSVLLVQWGETDLTRRALEAVRRSRYGGSIELLVWDNGSPGGPGDVAGVEDVTLVENGANEGFGPANNGLAERASGELLLFLNNDTVLAPACLARLVDALTSDAGVSAVGPQFRTFDGRVLELGGFLGEAAEGWQLFRGERPPRALVERPVEAHYVSAACLLMRREEFLAAGGFDPFFAPAYYEDTDLCLRLSEEGGRIVVEPRAVAYHLEGGTAGTDEAVGAKAYQRRNRGRFLARWAKRLEALPPASRGASLRHALTGGRRPLVLWLLPEFYKPDQSGGHARVRKEIEALLHGGYAVVLWSEHTGDSGRYGPLLSDLGVTWCGAHEPVRSILGRREGAALSSLEEVVGLDVWDAIVAWSADAADRFGPVVRQAAPRTPFLVDSSVLLYRQCERGLVVGASMSESLVIEKQWELGIYGAADGLVASSHADAEAIRAELPALDVTVFDVGAYEPLPGATEPHAGSLIFLGNFVHPPNLDAVVWWVEEIAPRVQDLCGRAIPLRVVGNAAELIATVVKPGPAVEVVGWLEDLRPEMRAARACLVPLRYGAGTKDKISVAMRFGLPTISTSVGAESMPPSLLDALLVADGADRLAAKVSRLMCDDRAWSRAAARTRKAATLAWDAQRNDEHRFGEWFDRFAKGARERQGR